MQRLAIESEETPKALDYARNQIWWWSSALCVVLVFAWPLLALPAGVFSKVSSHGHECIHDHICGLALRSIDESLSFYQRMLKVPGARLKSRLLMSMEENRKT